MSSAAVCPSFALDFTYLLKTFLIGLPLIESVLDIDILLEHVVHDIANTLGGIEVTVWLREENAGRLVLRGMRGCTQYRKGQQLNAGRALVASAAASGEIRYATDVRQEPLYVACESTTRSELCIPLNVEDRTIGVLCIDHERLDAFPKELILVLTALARHLGIVIESAFRFDRERS